MNLKKILILTKPLLSLILIFFLLFEIQRAWTGFPKIDIKISISKQQETFFNIHHYMKEWKQFAYFTTLSNIAMVTIIFLNWFLKIKIHSLIKSIILTYMFISSFVFWIALAPSIVWNQSSYFSFIMFYEHAVPTFIGFFFALENKKYFNFKKGLKYLLAFPFMYLIFIILFYVFTDGQVAIYPFFNFENIFYWNLHKSLSIFLSFIFLIFVVFLFIAVYWLIYKLFFRIIK